MKGPIISGEMTVMMEGSPCARMGDNGVHTMTCCGPNTYMITKGSGTVIVGKKPASRIGDSTLHCGMASGNIIKGAGTVMVGG